MEVIGFGSSVVIGSGYAPAGTFSCVRFRVDATTKNVPISAVSDRPSYAARRDVGVRGASTARSGRAAGRSACRRREASRSARIDA